MSNSDLAINIENLKKTYGAGKRFPAKEALKGVDLKVKKGSIFGLLGPNGAGKSTMINIISGTVVKTSGKVEICNYDIDREPRKVSQVIGIVPQELIIDPFFNVYETLDIYAGYYGVRKKDRKTMEIMESMGLADKAKSKPRMLSGGMRRRLLVAKALVNDPQILILDEPTAGVDVSLRDQLWNYVKKLNKEKNVTILLTTHYLEEAEQLCDEIAIIDKGKVIACDKKKNLLDIFGVKEIIVTLSKKITAIPESIKKEFECQINGENELKINYKAHDYSVIDILDKVKKTGLEIIEIATKEAKLEDAFKKLVNI